MKNLFAVAGLLAATSASADLHNTPADIKITCNQHGAIVDAQDGSTYYLGKQCDAARKGGGTGKWWFAAAAFLIEIDGQTMRFANELSCDVPYCRP